MSSINSAHALEADLRQCMMQCMLRPGRHVDGQKAKGTPIDRGLTGTYACSGSVPEPRLGRPVAAERIAMALRSAAIEVWFDKNALRGGA
jgi:hypothetical protein